MKSMEIKKLDWDSNFFGLKIGEASYEILIGFDKILDFDLLYISSLSDFDFKLENYEKTFSEAKVSFVKKISNKNELDLKIVSFDESNTDIETLYNLAFESGKNSRFLLDTSFKLNDFHRLYKIWIDNSISKKIADDVLIYQENNNIIGFVTYKIKDKNATIGLIAVDSNFQGKGIGRKLINHLESVLHQKSIDSLTIPTQLTNIQACNFYKKQGYSIEEVKYIKHYWKK